MPYLRSANQSNFTPIDKPGPYNYVHGADTRQHYIPLAFQVTSPYDMKKALLPHALILHVNPASFAETFNKKVERFQTLGGFVEQHWGDDLSEISGDQSTGAFINLHTGLSSILRQRTIAWDRYQDLYDLYRNNGGVYSPYGDIPLQGWILLIYDRGTYVGTFRSFSVEETDDSPFAFKISWSFKVEKIIQQIPQNSLLINRRSVAFQSQNQTTTNVKAYGPTTEGVVTPTLLLEGQSQSPVKDQWKNLGGFQVNGHQGLDLSAPKGTPIYPMAGGVVMKYKPTTDPEGGNVIYIMSPDGVMTYYAHCDQVNVKPGDIVDSDTVIGTVGTSGNAKDTGPHLHFQVWSNGQIQDPAVYFPVPPYNHSTS